MGKIRTEIVYRARYYIEWDYLAAHYESFVD